ncbi:hypothetical protein OAN24_02300 [Pseudodesulfovibrio sp.]|nr:hypothetical protein [Pseudodesulfovibrio sp.]
MQLKARQYAHKLDTLRAILGWKEEPASEKSEVYAGVRVLDRYCRAYVQHGNDAGESYARGIERLPLCGHYPIDLSWDEHACGFLISQNDRVEEFGKDWSLRRIRCGGRIFDRSPYAVILDGVIVLCPAGGETIIAYSRETDQEVASVSIGYSVGRLYSYFGKVLASCVDGGGRPILLVINEDLVVERTVRMPSGVEVYPESEVQLSILGEDTLLLLCNGMISKQQVMTYSLSEERVIETFPLRFLHSRAWSVLKVNSKWLVSGDFFIAGLDPEGTLCFYRHVPGFNCNLLRQVFQGDGAGLYCLCSVNRTVLRLHPEKMLPLAEVEGHVEEWRS